MTTTINGVIQMKRIQGKLLARLILVQFGISALMLSTPTFAVPLQQLFADTQAQIQVNDKIFDQWTLNFIDDTSLISPDLSAVTILPLTGGGADPGPGLRYDFGDELAANCPTVGCGETDIIALEFSYRVRTAGGEPRIKGNSLEVVEFLSTDLTTWYIQERLFSDSGFSTSLGTKQVDNAGGFNLFDSIDFAPTSELYINTSIIFSIAAGDPAADTCDAGICLTGQIGVFEQRFSQRPIPEPATLALIGLGLAGIGYRLHRYHNVAL